MRVSELIAPAFLVITLAGFSTHVGSAQTPKLECAQLSNLPDDGSSLAAGLEVLASKKIDPLNSLGELSEGGTGVPQNYQTAKSWYKKAADLGNADAMGNLGALFESGRGGPQLLETAREWYVKGAALNGRGRRIRTN